MNRAIVTASCVALAGLALGRPDRNAFLNSAATTTASLIRQVRSDATVSDRYQRHFAMSKHDVIAYLGELHPARTTADQVMMVYGVPETGSIHAHMEVFKAGTPVFSNGVNRPILIMKCGNPVTRGPRSPQSDNEIIVDTEPTEKVALKELEEVPTLATRTETERPLFEPTYQPVTETPVTPETVKEAPITITPVTHSLLPWAGLGLGLGAILGGHGHGSPVPEPASVIALTLGIGAVALRRRLASK